MLALVAWAVRTGHKMHFMQEKSADLYMNRNLSICPTYIRNSKGEVEQQLYPMDISQWQPFNGKMKPDRIFWIDTDMVFTPHQFDTLLHHDVELVGGVCMSGPNDITLGYHSTIQEKGWEYTSNLPRFKQGPNGEIVDAFAMWVADKKNEQGLCPVDYSGLAFLCTKLSVYEKLGYPYFHTTTFAHGMNIQTSEDVGFCRRVKDKGMDIYVDPDVLIGHQKTIELRVEVQA